jgi:septal ring factor EnvC (AmiA/AmiB activator)
MTRFLIIIFTAFIFAASASAQEVKQGDIDKVLQNQKDASEREAKLKAEREKIQGEVRTLNKRLSQQVQTLSKLGGNLSSTQARITQLDAEYQQLKTDLTRDDAELSKFLGYIQRLDRRAPSPVLTSPRSALKASQSALLIQSLTREFDQRSQALQGRLNDINRIKTALITERASLEQKQSQIQREETNLKSLLGQRNKTEARIANEEKQARQNAAKLAAQAESLKQLLDALTAEAAKIKPRRKPPISGRTGPAPQTSFAQAPNIRAFTRAKKTLIAPVIGRLTQKFGGSAQGITLSAPPRSVVKAPYSGRVEFAGAFKDYDRVVILNVGEGYFLLLTGLGTIIVEAGDSVKAGELVGALPASLAGNSDIYVEIRKNGAPIDPAPWFKSF